MGMAEGKTGRRINGGWLAYGCVCLAAYLLFVHTDVMETANHAYLLLESLFSGRLLHFYEDVMTHANTLYYINNAHYNIALYLIFAVAELPVFLFNAIFKTAVNETLLYFVGKLVATGFFAGCLFLTALLARQLGLDKADARLAALLVALWPPAFFSVLVMGQYDSIPLFFLLLGLLYWMRGRQTLGSLWLGVAAACKFLPLLAFLPLLLLWEKRPLHIIKHGLLALWLILPTGLLFLGRTGDMALFNGEMLGRLFAARLPGMGSLPVFPLLYALLCVLAFVWQPRDRHRAGMWLALAALGLLFLLVDWHPQWLILLAPFAVLTTLSVNRRPVWLWLDLALYAGFFLYLALSHPYQLEANLLDFGLVGLATGLRTSAVAGYNAISFYYALVPAVLEVPILLFCVGLAGQVLLKWPLGDGCLADRLAGRSAPPVVAGMRRQTFWARAAFAAGMAVWLLPTLFTWGKCYGFW